MKVGSLSETSFVSWLYALPLLEMSAPALKLIETLLLVTSAE